MPNGVDTVEWHAMSDERRAQFMRDKRKQEAFKTEMCKGFIRTGYCRYGAECRFAHFQEELRVRPVYSLKKIMLIFFCFQNKNFKFFKLFFNLFKENWRVKKSLSKGSG